MRNIIIFGASKGLGNSMVDGLGKSGDTFYLVSRSKPLNISKKERFKKVWIKADLSKTKDLKIISDKLQGVSLDVFVYNAGIWEMNDFEKTKRKEIRDIIHVNLTSPIILVQQLLSNLRMGKNKKVIFIGSTCGLENEGSDAVVYTATKFGVRGIAHSLREYLREDSISVSCISPGSIASDIPYSDGTKAALKTYNKERIPVSDLIDIIKIIIASSAASCIKEVHVPALKDTDA